MTISMSAPETCVWSFELHFNNRVVATADWRNRRSCFFRHSLLHRCRYTFNRMTQPNSKIMVFYPTLFEFQDYSKCIIFMEASKGAHKFGN